MFAFVDLFLNCNVDKLLIFVFSSMLFMTVTVIIRYLDMQENEMLVFQLNKLLIK